MRFYINALPNGSIKYQSNQVLVLIKKEFSKMSKFPTVRLNNGVEMPVFGLGTWQAIDGKEPEAKEAVKLAIDIGYRLFDCAHIYGNEKEVGEAIQEKIREGVVKREDLFITSKLWNNAHRPDLVEPTLRRTLKHLQLDYLDLYLIHWPQAYKEDGDDRPVDPKTGLLLMSDVDYVDTWKAMEEVYKKKLTRSIGISNFNSKQIERVLKVATVTPAVNQVECHPYLNQRKLREFCESKGIKINAYSPLGSKVRPWAKPGDPDVISDAKVKQIADKYGKTSAQILIRYNIQLGTIPVPKSSNPEHLRSNFDVLNFTLTSEDMAFLNTLDFNGRICPFLETKHSRYYPFTPDVEF